MNSDNDKLEAVSVESDTNRIADMLDDESEAAVEALLFASPEPLSDKEIAKIIGKRKGDIPGIIGTLNSKYEQWGRSFRVEFFGSRYRFYTVPEFDQYIGRLADIPRPVKLSKAALEVLSVIAYRQPVVKAEIEKIRGLNSDGVIRTLVERNLIETSGRSDGPGRPILYRTTSEFLEFFGISDISELPEPEIQEEEKNTVGKLTLSRLPENFDSPESPDEAE